MSLHFNVSQLLKSDVGDSRTYDFSLDRPINLGEGGAENVNGSVKFMLTNFGILARGKAHGDLTLTCARCLEPFSAGVEVELDEEYQPLIDIETGKPATTPLSDLAFGISPNHTIDLGEAIRQQMLLAIEIVPLCRTDCRGLCPTCGRNLNVESCDCAQAEESSPFAVLQDLLKPQFSERA